MFTSASLFWRDFLGRAHPDRENRLFAFLFGLVAPIGGSLVSVLFWMAVVWSAFGWLRGWHRAPWRAGPSRVVFAFLAWFAINAIWTIANNGIPASYLLVSPFAFVGALFLIEPMRRSDPGALLDLLMIGAATGALCGLLLALWQVSGDLPRAEGATGNALVFATVCGVAMALSLNLHLRSDSWRRNLGLAGFAAAFACCILSGSRIAVAIVPVAIGAVLLAQDAPRLLQFSRRVSAVVLLAALLGVSMWSITSTERFETMLDDLSNAHITADARTSTGQRIVMWRAATAAVADRPLAGYGIGGRMGAVDAHVRDTPQVFGNFRHPHNAYLSAMLDAGLVGLFGLAAVLLAPVAVVLRAGRDALYPTRKALMLSVVAIYAVSGLTNLMFGHDILDTLFLAVVATVVGSLPPTGEGAGAISANARRSPGLREKLGGV